MVDGRTLLVPRGVAAGSFTDTLLGGWLGAGPILARQVCDPRLAELAAGVTRLLSYEERAVSGVPLIREFRRDRYCVSVKRRLEQADGGVGGQLGVGTTKSKGTKAFSGVPGIAMRFQRAKGLFLILLR